MVILMSVPIHTHAYAHSLTDSLTHSFSYASSHTHSLTHTHLHSLTQLHIVHTGVRAVATGGKHSLVLRTDGTVWVTGDNSFGQLGDGTTIDKNTFVKLSSGR